MPGVGLTEKRLPTAEIYHKNRRNTYDPFPGTFSEISYSPGSGLCSVITAALRPLVVYRPLTHRLLKVREDSFLPDRKRQKH